MQDEVRDRSINLTINVGKTGGRLTADLLKWAIRRHLANASNPKVRRGKQTVRQLIGQGAGVKNIEITDKNIRSFESVARKYGVDYALKKDTAAGKYYVFFKGRDEDAITSAFREYTAKTIRRGAAKPSLRQELHRLMEQVKNAALDAVKKRDKGEIPR